MFTRILVAVLVVVFLIQAVVGYVRRDVLRKRIAAGLGRYYAQTIAMWWALAVWAVAAVLDESRLTVANVGWAWPGDGYWHASHGVVISTTWGLTGYVLLMMVIGTIRARARLRAGRTIPGRAEIAMMIPRTASERRLAVGVSITAGVTEELIFRGLLIVTGVELFHLPVLVAAAISLVLFAAGHSYQGTRGTLGALAVGFIYTFLYLISGSIIPGILAHTVQDLVALLLVPAEASPKVERPDQAGPAETGEPEQTGESGSPVPRIRSASPG